MILWCTAPFLLESPISQADDPPGWKVFTGALTCEFSKPSVTPTLAQPLWLLQEHTLTGGHVKHGWPDHRVHLCVRAGSGVLSALPCLPSGSACTLCQPTLWVQGDSLSFNPLLHEASGDTTLAEECECHGVPDAHLCHHPAIPTATPSH